MRFLCINWNYGLADGHWTCYSLGNHEANGYCEESPEYFVSVTPPPPGRRNDFCLRHFKIDESRPTSLIWFEWNV